MLARLAARLALLAVFLGTAALAQGTAPAAPQAEDPLVVVQRFLDAYSHHNLGLMIAETDPDVKWMSVVNDRILVDAAGQQALQGWLVKVFSAFPVMSRTVEQSIAHGTLVSVWERAHLKARDNADMTQGGLVVYEVRNGKIKNVWRYTPQE
jgi:ketosteroid isomerase-like protein